MRRSLVLSLACVSGLLLGLAHEGWADEGFRCKTGRLVSVGDAMKEVRDRCGEPDEASTRVERRKVKHRYTRRIGNVEESVVEEHEVEVPLDEWTYDMGPRAFTRYVTFEGGRVVAVATGDYGHK
jgi:hypothetical protein